MRFHFSRISLFHIYEKNTVIWEQLSILVINIPGWLKLIISSWGSPGARPHCWSRCAHLTCSLDSNDLGLSRRAGRSKTTTCQLKQSSQAQIPIPSVHKFCPSSHPYHHLEKRWLRSRNYIRTREWMKAGAATLACTVSKDKWGSIFQSKRQVLFHLGLRLWTGEEKKKLFRDQPAQELWLKALKEETTSNNKLSHPGPDPLPKWIVRRSPVFIFARNKHMCIYIAWTKADQK